MVGQLRSPILDPSRLSQALHGRSHEQRSRSCAQYSPRVRDEEVVDTVEIGRPAFHEQLVAIGMGSDVGLFSAWHAKESPLRGDCLTIRQESANKPPHRYARFELRPSGVLLVESNVTGRRDVDRGAGMFGPQILEQDVTDVLREHFAFAPASMISWTRSSAIMP